MPDSMEKLWQDHEYNLDKKPES